MPSLDEALTPDEDDRRSLRELVVGPPLIVMFFLLTAWYTTAAYGVAIFGHNLFTIGFGSPISVLIAPWWFVVGGVSLGDIRMVFVFVLWMYIVSAGVLLTIRGISVLIGKAQRWLQAEVKEAVNLPQKTN